MFNQEEKQALIALLEISLKAGGLKVANDVMYFVNKLSTSEPTEPPKVVKEPTPKN